MKQYIPNTSDNVHEMLQAIKVSSVSDLFADIPESVRLSKPLQLPQGMTEPELIEHVTALANQNVAISQRSFLGAGAYNHFIPSVIPYLTQRGEFLTAYTPYQPEVSQGTLQAIFEFQTLICQLTGMEVANASMYDGASSLAEAVLMAHRITKRTKVLLIEGIHPLYERVLRSYTQNLPIDLITLPTEDGTVALDLLTRSIDAQTIAVVVQNPNFYGVIQPLAAIKSAIADPKVLFITAVTEGISLGILQAPGACGADIVVGETQSFGIPLSFGGPYAGFFAVKRDYMRVMPGRLCGVTTDKNGKRGFVLTLSTREQHIRREKATSNICSNQALCALTASIYLSMLGKTGLRTVAEQNLQKAHYLFNKLIAIPGITAAYQKPFFNEFVLKTPIPAHQLLGDLNSAKFIAGLDMARFFSDRPNELLICATEVNHRADMDEYASAIKQILAERSKGGYCND